MNQSPFARRIQSLLRTLRQRGGRVVLAVSSSSERARNADSHFPFRQASSFFYLTGAAEPSGTLLLKSDQRKPLLIVRRPTEQERIWDGERGSPRTVAKHIGASLLEVDDPLSELRKQIRGYRELFFDSEGDGASFALAQSITALPGHQRTMLPQSLSHVDPLLEPLRLRKDRYEIAAMKTAAAITEQSVTAAIPFLTVGNSEQMLANVINAQMVFRGCTMAFNTIVAAGSSAATLHHRPSSNKIRSNDLVLIDCGAEYGLYAADMTRTFPASGRFTPAQRELYRAVLDAQLAAIAEIRDGVSVTTVFEAAVRELIVYLRAHRLISGTTKSILTKRSYRQYFPHGIGHSLGLDVHDIGALRAYTDARLRSGMIFTVEPGLYFRKPARGIQACGVRIEDAVVVTNRGATVLTQTVPKQPDEIEAWMADKA